MSEFFHGIIGGATGVTLCYPIGTLKTRLQTIEGYSPLKDLRTNGLRSLYLGYASPLAGMMLEKSVLFYGYDHIKRMWQNNTPMIGGKSIEFTPFRGGLFAGVLTTFVVTPFERVMIVSQTSKVSTPTSIRRIIQTDGLLSFYKGFTMTWLREVPGYAIYFSVYERLKNQLPAPIVGACCGISAWAVIYPSDPVKTVMQERNVGVINAASQVYSRGGFRGFYIGFLYGIVRAGILHAGVISGYQTSKRLFD